MYKKLCILLIGKYHRHKLYAIFANAMNICKQVAINFANESGNVPRKGVVPRFSYLQIIAVENPQLNNNKGMIYILTFCFSTLPRFKYSEERYYPSIKIEATETRHKTK